MLSMVSYPHRPKSGHITCYLNPIELIQVPEKSTGALCCDRVRGESRTREVFPVVRYDCLRTGADRRCEDMAIFIVVCHGRNQILVAFHPSFPEVFADLPLAVNRLVGGHAEVLLEVPTHLRHNLVSPFRKIEPRTAREPQQRV